MALLPASPSEVDSLDRRRRFLLGSPKFVISRVMSAFMQVSQQMRNEASPTRSVGVSEAIAGLNSRVKKAVFIYARASGESSSFGQAYGSAPCKTAPSYGADGFIKAPWSALGILCYAVGPNGRERRDRVVRWRVHDVHLADADAIFETATG